MAQKITPGLALRQLQQSQQAMKKVRKGLVHVREADPSDRPELAQQVLQAGWETLTRTHRELAAIPLAGGDRGGDAQADRRPALRDGPARPAPSARAERPGGARRGWTTTRSERSGDDRGDVAEGIGSAATSERQAGTDGGRSEGESAAAVPARELEPEANLPTVRVRSPGFHTFIFKKMVIGPGAGPEAQRRRPRPGDRPRRRAAGVRALELEVANPGPADRPGGVAAGPGVLGVEDRRGGRACGGRRSGSTR